MKTAILTKNNVSKSMMVGASFLLLSALLMSVSQVYYANQVQGVHPFLFTGVSFFITTILFNMIAFKQRRTSTVSVRASLGDLVKLNGSSILAFMGFYYALKFIEPAIVSSLEMGVGPFFAIVVTAMLAKEKIRATRAQWIITAGTFAASVLLMLTALFGFSGVQVANTADFMYGIVASVLCGLGAVLCTIYSKKLSNAGWTSSAILAHRFYGIITLSFLMTCAILPTYLMANIDWIVLVTIFGVALPTFLLQKGIQYCEPFFVMMTICFIPVFTFAFQLFDPRIEWSTLSLIGIVMLFLLGVASIFSESKA
ncbi:EamA family transporter [Sporosarcina sp. YIM B06819]|uniref:EamA family transporter n=1 Tax=Sporosarcina sp. YIM B06819 TaxID=3081769 RepID=UPI00298C2FCE|nr:EamA family transporter [Sporosarcina sp. YIM B06819]